MFTRPHDVTCQWLYYEINFTVVTFYSHYHDTDAIHTMSYNCIMRYMTKWIMSASSSLWSDYFDYFLQLSNSLQTLTREESGMGSSSLTLKSSKRCPTIVSFIGVLIQHCTPPITIHHCIVNQLGMIGI